MKLIFLIISLFSVSHAQTTGDVKFYFLGTSFTDFKIVTTGSGFLTVKNTEYYNPIKGTAIYFHGYQSNFTSADVQTIAKAYLERGDQNVIMVDWGKFTNSNFIALVQSMPSVAVFVTNILNEMKNLGLDLAKVHIIGYSAGAQLAGMIGTNFKTTKNFSFCRITGLDPAGPFFLDDDTTVQNCPITMPELGRNDANLVDIIHTDSNALGYANKESGHIDFWPNGGKIQAGCLWSCFSEGPSCLSCSHSRAWIFYAESLINVAGFNNRFLAKQCPVGATEFTGTNCVGPTTKLMGYFMNNAGSVGNCTNFGTTFIGNFFLETNSQSPYSKTLDYTQDACIKYAREFSPIELNFGYYCDLIVTICDSLSVFFEFWTFQNFELSLAYFMKSVRENL